MKKCFVCDSSDNFPKGMFCLGKNKIISSDKSVLEMPLAECRNCGFVFVSSLPSDDEVNAYYKSDVFWQSKMSTSVNTEFPCWSDVFEQNPSLHERHSRAIRQFNYIAKLRNFEKNTSVIDVGAGFSPFLYVCKENNLKNLYAIEPSEEICDFLEKQGVSIAANTFEEWFDKNENKKFDLIVVSHTLEHLKDPGYFLSNISKYLSPNGVLYIEVPHRDDRQEIHGGLHFLFFDVTTLRLAIEKYGFQVIDVKNIRYNFLGLIIRKLLLTYYIFSRFCYNKMKPKKNYSIQNSFFTFVYYNVWFPLIKIFNIELYIYISSDDVVSLSSLKKN
jgi:2-polyprenyl-3-methyl-5-hydroxy-6-metoxy-1,4-benzoquinol methylase